MDIGTIVRLIILIGIVQGIVFNIFVFFNRKKLDISIKYLNIVVLSLSLNNLREFVFEGDYFSEIFIKIYLSFPWHFLVAPMFYVFLVYYLKANDKFTSYLKLTVVIFGIEILIRVCYIIFSSNFETTFNEYIIVEEMCNAIYSIFIFYHILKLLFFDKGTFINIASFDNIVWIKNTVKLGVGIMVLWIFAVVYYYITRNDWIYDPLKIIYSLLIYWLGYQGLIHSKIRNDRVSLRNHIKTEDANLILSLADQTESTELKEKHKIEFETIENYIIKKERYLDPIFSLEKLSDELGISLSHLSKLINSHSSHNFSDFVNSLRVQQAEKFLASSEFNQYTIVAIGLECGFNSKSTFYSAFKKFTSKTPTEFRKSQ